MTTKKVFIWILAFVYALIIGSCNRSSESNKEQLMEVETVSSPIPKNNLITIRLEAIVNSHARYGVSNIKCNYGDGRYMGFRGSYGNGKYYGTLFRSGDIVVPSGKYWIYKDLKIIKEAPITYRSQAVIAKKNKALISLIDPSFTGITLHEGNVFSVYCSAMDSDNKARQIPDGSAIGMEFTFVEAEF
jgi:hypothetical protein